MCIRAHERAVIDGGLTPDHVNDAVRIAATMQAAAVALEMEAPVLERAPLRTAALIVGAGQISEAFRQADWLSHGGDPLRISRAAIAC